MNIGIVGYRNNSGLGQIVFFLKKHLGIGYHLVICNPVKGTRPVERLPCQCMLTDLPPTQEQCVEFLDTFPLDVLLVLETPFCWELLVQAKQRGIKIIYIPMFDSVPLAGIRHQNLVDCYIAWTASAYEVLHKAGLPAVRLHYPVDTDYFQFRYRGQSPHFVHSVGFNPRRKGTSQVVSAFSRLYQEQVSMKTGHRPRLTLFGQTQALQGICSDALGVRTYAEDFEEATEIYSVGHFYVAPSLKEGLGLSLYEAMACGFPVIASALPEWMSVVPDKSLLVKPGSRVDLFAKMQSVLGKDLRGHGKANRRRIEELYSWVALRSAYVRLLELVVTKGSGAVESYQIERYKWEVLDASS